MDQAALTVVAPIDPAALRPLRALLTSIDEQVKDPSRRGKLRDDYGASFPFDDLTTVHFARFVVLDPPANDPGTPPLLIFATDYDGSPVRHLRELITVAGKALNDVFSHCTAFHDDASGKLEDRLRRFLTGPHSHYDNASWVGHPGRMVHQIAAESELHGALERKLGDSSGRLCSEPFADALRHVREKKDLRWALLPPDRTTIPFFRKWLRLGAFGVCVFALVFVVPVLPVWLLRVRMLELREDRRRTAHTEPELVDASGEFDDHQRSLLDDEDLRVQNQMTAVSEVKPGRLRLATLRAVLWLVDFLGHNYWDKGDLNGIRTIHFARWFVVKQGKTHRLVFFSNYDGSWESYLGEFIDHSPSGLTGIWSNCVRNVLPRGSGKLTVVPFPKTRWLFRSGARREMEFKNFVRACQVKTQVWYGAYPDLTVLNVLNNSEIRRGLQGLRGLGGRRAWLRRL